MKTLHLPEKTNTTEKPWQNVRGMGMTKGYKSANILDSFAFYGRDIPEKRYGFYRMILDRIDTIKQDKKNPENPVNPVKKRKGVIDSGTVKT